jgi:protein SCO1/2
MSWQWPILCWILAIGCTFATPPKKLPYLGNHEFETGMRKEVSYTDTLYYRIPDFSFADQTGRAVTRESLSGKVYVADFFFTSCPSICPVMKRNMLTIYNELAAEPDFLLVSHSIDPVRDSVSVLAAYAQKLGIENHRWLFLTGDKKNMHQQAKAYMSSAVEDPRAPGGYMHSGAFVLVDKHGHIRAACDGTLEEDTRALIEDIKCLLSEE